MTEYIQVLTTVEHKADAEKMPLTSFFQWQEKLDSAQEYLCLIKSRDDLFSELEAAIKGMHPYEVPEILATPITRSGKDYLNWLAAEVKA
jgi:periplasmic divalent cation tolerance protein